MSVNRIDATLTDEQPDRANIDLAVLTEALPFLIDLNATDRTFNPKFCYKNRAYVGKTSLSLRHIPTGSRSVSTSRNSRGPFRSRTQIS